MFCGFFMMLGPKVKFKNKENCYSCKVHMKGGVLSWPYFFTECFSNFAFNWISKFSSFICSCSTCMV